MKMSAKKQEILKAASDYFARFGYEKTTLDDIGKMVGLNKTSLYYYYESKEAIFAEVISQEVEEYIQELYHRIQEIPGCRDRILTYLQEKFRYMQKLMNLHSLSMEAFRSVQPMFAQLFEQICEKEVNFINEILVGCIEHGEMKPVDSKRIAKTILTVVDAIKMKAVQEADIRFIDQIDPTQMEEEVVFTVSLILDGLMEKEPEQK